MIKIFKKKKIDDVNFFVEPDEIFLDSKNPQNFDRQQFEGRIEKPIPKRTILFFGILFLISIALLGSRIFYLQIQKGELYWKRSVNNILAKQVIFSERGIIYDRNGRKLAWNKKTEEDEGILTRAYLSPGFSHVLGYVSYPARDKSGNYWQSDFIGRDGLEKEYDNKIKGENGSKIIETDAFGKIHSENIVNAPVRGNDLITTIDWRVQQELFSLIKNFSKANFFQGGVGILMNAQNGEIAASVSFPEYDSEILSLGREKETIKNYLTDTKKIFLDRTISGLYTPGSIIKPFFAIAALSENIIDQHKKILSTGSISIPNPYFPDKKSIFKDWKAHGWTDMKQALAVSSDVYFYVIGGGFEEQKGLGIVLIEKYARLFGIGETTGADLPGEKRGIIPSPEWKAKNFPSDPWRLGDTYNTAIGQYGFQVTPMEMARAISAIGNDGALPSPHFVLNDKTKNEQVFVVDLAKEYFDVVREGMRQAVSYGTATVLKVPYVEVAAKTGTAQLGLQKNKVNSWVIGFFPYQSPKYAFVIMMEAGPASGGAGASSLMRGLLDWMSINTPEYFK